jgi:hypothetical protein
MDIHGLIQQPCSSKKAHFPMLEVDRADDISQRWDERFLRTIADNVHIVTTGVNDLNDGPEVTSVVAIHCQTFDLKPVVFACGEGGKPVPWDQHLMIAKGFSSGEIRTPLQPHEDAFVHLTPLNKRVLLHTRVLMLQKDVPLDKIRQQF